MCLHVLSSPCPPWNSVQLNYTRVIPLKSSQIVVFARSDRRVVKISFRIERMILAFDRVVGELARSGAYPRLTWTCAPERLELSGHVLANWAVKVANLLEQEGCAGGGARVVLDLPVHWRTVTWALGVWLAGSCVVAHADDPSDADLLVTDDPARWRTELAAGLPVVAVPLPSFALRWPGDLPAGVLDGAADVAGQPDQLGPLAPADLTDPALIVAGQTFLPSDLHRDLWYGLDAILTWQEGASVELACE